MKELKLRTSKFSESKSYPYLFKKELESLKGFSPADKRKWMEAWSKGFEKGTKIDWFKDMPPFKDPEYRIHPLLGHQVRSRHHFEPEGLTQEQRAAEKKTIPRRKPKLTPYEADPAYRDPKEPLHGVADLKGVKQQKVTLEDVTIFDLPAFKIKSPRLARSVKILDIKLGYDHRTNKQVLYSPLQYNERWDRQSQVIWLRIIGMSPKRIAKRLDIKYDTVKNWLRALKDQPLVATSEYDWAVRQVEGRGEYSTKFSGVEAKPRAREAI